MARVKRGHAWVEQVNHLQDYRKKYKKRGPSLSRRQMKKFNDVCKILVLSPELLQPDI
jgi:hypothetical protein